MNSSNFLCNKKKHYLLFTPHRKNTNFEEIIQLTAAMEFISKCIDSIGLSVILTFALVFFAVYYCYTTWEYDYWKKQGIPGHSAWPIVGTVKPTNIFKRIEIVDQVNHKKFGKVFGGFEGRVPVLYVIDPDLIKQVMVKDFPHFTNRRDFEGVNNDPTFNKMLSIMRDEEWKNTRAILSPTFTTGKLKQMVYLIEECVKVMLKSLDEFAEANEPVDVRRYFSAFTLDVIASCAFGMKTNSLTNQESEFIIQARKAFKSPAIVNFFVVILPKSFRLIQPILEYFFGNPFGYFIDVAGKMIDLRMKEKLQTRRDFLDLLIEAEQEEEKENAMTENTNSAPNNKKILTRSTMVANCMIFLLAGHETSATTLAFFAHCLATNPRVQDKLIQEIDDVMTECKGNLTYEIVMSLQYLDQALSETLRMYPPAIRVERACGSDGYKLGDVTMKRESLVVTSVYSLHYDESIYPNPEVYDPERFSPENKAKRHPFAYMPFGLGPRNCIAMRFALTEVKLAMAYILSQFRFNTCAKTEFPIEYNPGFGLLSPKSITLQLQKREDQPHFEN